MILFKFLILISLCYFSYAVRLPSYIKMCAVNDPDVTNCVINSANAAIPKIVKGVPKFGIPLLDPFVGLTADIQSAQLKLHVDNMNISGLGESKIIDFSMNFEEGVFNFVVDIPRIIIKGDYTIGGRILVIPLKGDGQIDLVADNATYNVNLKCAFIEKKGDEYMDCKTDKVDFIVKKGHVELSNLFNNPDISRETNKVLNQNFHDVIKELTPSISDTIREVTNLIIQRFFDKASTKEIFLNYTI